MEPRRVSLFFSLSSRTLLEYRVTSRTGYICIAIANRYDHFRDSDMSQPMETDHNMQEFTHQLRIMNQQIQAQALQIRQQAAQIEANQQMAAGTAEPTSMKAKLPDPTKFSGERFRYPAFEEQLVGKMRVVSRAQTRGGITR